jgi:hypothetical protein
MKLNGKRLDEEQVEVEVVQMSSVEVVQQMMEGTPVVEIPVEMRMDVVET